MGSQAKGAFSWEQIFEKKQRKNILVVQCCSLQKVKYYYPHPQHSRMEVQRTCLSKWKVTPLVDG